MRGVIAAILFSVALAGALALAAEAKSISTQITISVDYTTDCTSESAWHSSTPAVVTDSCGSAVYSQRVSQPRVSIDRHADLRTVEF